MIGPFLKKTNVSGAQLVVDRENLIPVWKPIKRHCYILAHCRYVPTYLYLCVMYV